MKRPLALIILDGFGYTPQTQYNAIARAHTPFIASLYNFPHTFLNAAGMAVGLPEGYIGNSQAGHATIGAGRIVQQPLTYVDQRIALGSFFENPILRHALVQIQQQTNRVHIIGLVSQSGVHGLARHLSAYAQAAHDAGISAIFVHAILDGRDAPPQSARIYLDQINIDLDVLQMGQIASLAGRFYAMDRDHNWERTRAYYRMLITPNPPASKQWSSVLDYYYAHAITDEFIPPTTLHPAGIIHAGDGVIITNVRPDRIRQLTMMLTNPTNVPDVKKYIQPSLVVTPFSYGTDYTTTFLYTQDPIHHTLKEILNAAGITIFTIAETEKYAHVTYFFDGNREDTFSHETRMLIQSLDEKSYAQHPEMSAHEITQQVMLSLNNNPRDFYLINYANADMVGHAGKLQATERAIECLDIQLRTLYDEIVTKMNGTMIVTADHGNAEVQYDEESHQRHTWHTRNKVPFFVVSRHEVLLPTSLRGLADIAPYILRELNIAVPPVMTGSPEQ